MIKKKTNSFNKSISMSGDKRLSIRCAIMASQVIGKSMFFNLLDSEDVNNTLLSIRKFCPKDFLARNFSIFTDKLNTFNQACGI